MKSLRIPADGSDSNWLERAPLAARAERNEAWLQKLLFEHPELIPIDEIDPGQVAVIPLCREFPIASAARSVFLDILGVTPLGRLVLIECKLWRNPQARREVIGQLLEYAGLLQGWSYGDLAARVATRRPQAGSPSSNLLFDLARERHAGLDEARFVDSVTQSLRRGDFDLLVAGDGIRSDAEAIATFLRDRTHLACRLALVEFQIWMEPSGATTVVPSLPFKTEVIEHRVIVGSDGVPLHTGTAEAADDVESEVDPERKAERESNRAFWQALMDDLVLENPDQVPPSHGGNNYIKLPLPEPADRLVAYRTKTGRVGVFFRLQGADGAALASEWQADLEPLREESALPLGIRTLDGGKGWAVSATAELRDDGEQARWLSSAINALVRTFRPRLGRAA